MRRSSISKSTLRDIAIAAAGLLATLVSLTALLSCAGPSSFSADESALIEIPGDRTVLTCVTPPALVALTDHLRLGGSVDARAALDWRVGSSSVGSVASLRGVDHLNQTHATVNGVIEWTERAIELYKLDARTVFLHVALYRLCELAANGLITPSDAASLFQMVATDAADLFDVERKPPHELP